MDSLRVDEIYETYVRPLPAGDRLRLLERLARDLAEVVPESKAEPLNSILELRGLGKAVWNDTDPQQYVNDLREEWDERG